MSDDHVVPDGEILVEGDRAPLICGAFADGAFFSTETYIGRTLVLVMADAAHSDEQLAWARTVAENQSKLAELDAVAVVLLSMNAKAMTTHLNPPTAALAIAQPSSDLSTLCGPGGAARVLVLDRSGRIVRVIDAVQPEHAMNELLPIATALQQPKGRIRNSVAPLLMVPNLIDARLCRALINAFESGDHLAGGMASIDAEGRPMLKIEEGKKHRRDLELTPEHDLHPQVLKALSSRLVPEISRAFNLHVAHADRILLVRYDDTGGYFHRHRDNAAPHVAFRQFAVSLNLNSEEYEGGELEFPEFDNDFYRPPTGAAAVFSASLMHAARPVLAGRRYVLLTFLHDASAEILRSGMLSDGG